MNTHFEILIDASGSMGYMRGAGKEYENKYLLPDGSTRTDLVKKILMNSIIPKLSFVDSLTISTFSAKLVLDTHGNPKLKNGEQQYIKKIDEKYTGPFDVINTSNAVKSLINPENAGTPLYTSLFLKINYSKYNDVNIVVLSDGDDGYVKDFDEKILARFEKINKNYKIYFIGIDLDVEAQKKSKNLATKTGGFYVNLDILNYNESLFDSMLFEWNTTITSNALKTNLRIDTPPAKKEPIITISDVKEKIVIEVKENKDEETVEEIIPATESKEIEEQIIEKIVPSALRTQVEENTKSLKLITSQLDSIVKEISYIRKGSSSVEDEFIANEDETYNRAVGYKCEKHLFTQYLKKYWNDVNWLNELEEQSNPYDFDFIKKNVKYFIECKGSVNSTKEFFLTKNEWQFYLQNRNNYRLYFVSEINSDSPTIIKIKDLIKSMEIGELIPCSSVNRKVKADRILFQIID